MHTLFVPSVSSLLFFSRFRLALAVALFVCSAINAHAAGPTGVLNDTGQTLCDDGSNVMTTCAIGNAGNAATYKSQDGRFGRDPAAPAKVGGGAAGFDFTKVCFNGDLQGTGTCTGTLIANTGDTATGTPSTDWACTKDNVTNLIWSLQSGYGDWTTYASTTLPTSTNTAIRCGFATGWRLPTRRELLGIAHNGAFGPAIDVNYFPATQSNNYWSGDTYTFTPNDEASYVSFGDGSVNSTDITWALYARLVRSGQ